MKYTLISRWAWVQRFLLQSVKGWARQLSGRLLRIAIAALLFIGLIPSPTAWAAANLSHAPEEARAYLIEPSDGQAVPETFAVKFGLVGMGVAPAGVDKEGTGHHHLLIDIDELPNLTEPLQASDQLKHFGAGQTETTLTLPPGEHTLQLVLGDYSHVPHDNPVVSEPVTITVE